MSAGPSDGDEARRIECEARAWLRDGYTTAEQVDALMPRIARHRGQAAADLLRSAMREQWRRRAEWLDPST